MSSAWTLRVRQEKVENSALRARFAKLNSLENNNFYFRDDKGAKGGPSLSGEIRRIGFLN